MATRWDTIDLETAKRAVEAYNNGKYRGEPNPELDRRARQTFEKGLGSTYEEILRQVDFIGRDYGGTGFKAAYALAPDITRDIVADREQYLQTARRAKPILSGIPDESAIEILYRPFVKEPLYGKSNWLVWGTKFWHFLNPDAFPIADRFVNKFFMVTGNNPVAKYLKFLNRFREFAGPRQEWLPEMRQVDKCVCSAWCDNKLWDKMCYGLGELKLLGKC